ncbi:MAG: 3-phosphoshikimate 1-carboxyvinyltransferase [Halodesulfurarchaeum sp.]
MDATVERSTLSGSVSAPPSKSYTHRAIFAAGYDGDASVRRPLLSADTRASVRAIEQFGAETSVAEDAIDVSGFGGDPIVPEDVLDCENSGTTMRLALGAAGLVDGITVLTGDASLRSRPQGPMLDAIEQLGGRAQSTRKNGNAPIVVEGWDGGGTVDIPGDVSSQFVTSLLMAGAVTDSGIEISLTSPLKSAPYVDITIDVLSAFGVDAGTTDGGYRVAGGQEYDLAGQEYTIPGDFSSVSYLLAAGAIAGDTVEIDGVFPGPQGDSAIIEIVEEMGGDVDWDRDDGVLTIRESSLTGTTVDVGNTPDLLPTIAVLGAVASGRTHITNCEHVRYKETDRVTAMAEALSKMGASVTEHPDELIVDGSDSDLMGATLDGRGDHRIVMALSVAGLEATGETTITGAEDVDVSFPNFFDVLSDLGATVQLGQD